MKFDFTQYPVQSTLEQGSRIVKRHNEFAYIDKLFVFPCVSMTGKQAFCIISSMKVS